MVDSAREKNEAIAKKRADLLGMRYFDTTQLTDLPMFVGIMDNDFMYQNQSVILTHQDRSYIIGITSKTPQTALDQIRDKFPDDRITFVMISELGFKDFMVKYDPPEEIDYKDVDITSDSGSSTLKEVSETIEKVLPDEMLDYLLRQALKLMASDIHLENSREENVRIRFRVHGVLHDIATLSFEKYRQLMSSIAKFADIASASPDPQTGHITYNIDDNEINIRIETVPALYGQDVVLRVFSLTKELLELETLGLDDNEMQAIEEVVEHPTGLVLTVGPTGSGKTTTLYAILNKLNHPSRKIITLEDPVEYSLPGLVQIPINTMKKKSFADGLRAVLRMDPDVIMVGEIRDADTANTALQAALSGHLVLSTFHASDASSAIARLLTFTGGNPLFTTALRLVVAQRLVRRLDDQTKEKYTPDDHIFEAIGNTLGESTPDRGSVELFRAIPSEKSPFGYEGRTAVVEIMEMTNDIERAIHDKGVDLVADDIRELSKKHGRKTLLADALHKALDGETTIEEVYRVI